MDAIFQHVLQRFETCIKKMRSRACEDGLQFGLRGVPDYLYCLENDPGFRLGLCTNRWESVITKEIARQFADRTKPEEPSYPAEVIRMPDWHRLPRGKKSARGDLLISLDDYIPLFVECKSVFECVLRKLPKTAPITDSEGRRYGRDYSAKDENILDDPKNAMTCVSIEEAWIDAMKLNCLWRLEQPKYHLGLLLLEFDRKGHDLSNRRDYKDLEEKLRNDHWFQVGRKSWDDKASIRAEKGFQEHLVLWVKEARAAAASAL